MGASRQGGQAPFEAHQGCGEFPEQARMALLLVGVGVVTTLANLNYRRWPIAGDQAQGQGQLLAQGRSGQLGPIEQGGGGQFCHQLPQVLLAGLLQLQQSPQGWVFAGLPRCRPGLVGVAQIRSL